jgi:hypothetical protein
MVSFLSAITILGTPSEIYLYGTMFCYQGEVIVCFSLNLSFIDWYEGKTQTEDTYPFRSYFRLCRFSLDKELILIENTKSFMFGVEYYVFIIQFAVYF